VCERGEGEGVREGERRGWEGGRVGGREGGRERGREGMEREGGEEEREFYQQSFF
jgi:hypothetical protein